MKFNCLILLTLLLACKSDTSHQRVLADGLKSEGEAAGIYRMHCSGCHGTDLQGNNAPGLIQNHWKYGKSKSLMVRNVTFGIPGTEMAAFQNMLSSQEIDLVVNYILDRQSEPANTGVQIPSELTTEDYQVQVEEIVSEGLETPWAIEFIDKSTAVISEKTGALRWLREDKLDPNAIEGTPLTHLGSSTGGYMDIALDPDYHANGWVYLAYSHCRSDYTNENALATTRIVRGKIDGYQWVDEQTLFEVPDSLWAVANGNRWGCRFLFDQAGRLLFTIGDMGRDIDSQDLRKATGKIFRINPDGTIPRDNPFRSHEGALSAIYTLGTRNVQGLDIHPVTGAIWASDHGPMGGDELNIVKPGANYGWPMITYGVDYDGSTVSAHTEQAGMEQPVHYWTPSIGICPIAFVKSSMFARWNNHLLVGALAFEQIIRCVISDDQIIHQEIIYQSAGRVRDIKVAPDQSIYVVLNRPDKILRLSTQIL